MFTGIVREVGRVVEVDAGDAGATLRIAAPETAARTAVGDSVAIGGVCLTAESVEGETMRFHAVPETLSRSTLGGLRAGDGVNVEPALRAGEPLGGHIVQGHVDGLGSVCAVEQEGDGVRVSFDAPPELLGYLVEKGSVTVDGVSLTVAGLDERRLRRRADPAHAVRDDARRARPGRAGQPRGRRAREVRRAARGPEVTMIR